MSARESRKSRSTPDLIPLLNRNPNPPLIFLRRRLLPRPSQVGLTWPHHVRRHALAATIFHFFASWIVASPRSSSASSSSMGEASPVPPPPDAGAAFVLESKGGELVARGVPSHDGDRRPHNPDAAVRIPRAGLGGGAGGADGRGRRHLLRLHPHVQGPGSLREARPTAHPVPGTRRRRLGLRLDVLLRGVLPDCHQHRSEHRLRLARRRMPQGYSRNAPPRNYSLDSSRVQRTFNAFTSISILASLYGNGILPEIQATMAPPATGKMVKGLMLCYSVIIVTFYSAAVSGYWAFGNKVNSNVLDSLLPDSGPSLAPTWLLGLAVVFVLLQLLAIGLVYSQVAYEIIEKNSADIKKSKFSKRNLVPRLILRTLYMAFCGFMAAMLPFFGDIVAVVGAIGFIPLDFVLPMLLYNISIGPSKRSAIHWINIFIMVVFTGVGIMGAFASIRKLVLDAHQFKLFSNDVVG
nr:PREDICTED: probable GABA transporter 2 isoform X3 [Musa acuminata subsp. malaccensis]